MKRHSLGVTLIELIVFIVIVSVALAGVLAAFNTAVVGSADPLVRKQALVIAEALLQEVMQKSFQNDPTGDNAATPALGCTPTTTPSCRTTPAAAAAVDRQNYNDVDDFNGFSQTGITQIDGTTAIPSLSSYSVSVGVAASTMSGVAGKLITVTASGGGQTITLSGFRTNYE